MKGRPPGKAAGPSRGARKPSSGGAQGRARGASKAARVRKEEAPKPAAKPAAKAAPAKAPSAKGVSLDVRQFRVGADDDGIRLDRWFQRNLPDVGFNAVSRWARTGQLRLDGARAAPGDRVAAGQTIRVPPAEPKAAESLKPQRVRPELGEDQTAFAQGLVIHRDAQAIVINKPPGLATQGGTKTDDHVDGLLDALVYELDQRPKLVHRLDKDTSGALLVARTARSAAFFAKAFSSRTARKVYWAIVIGVPSIDDGMIELPIAKQPGTGGEKMHVDEEEGLPSRSRYRVIERAGNRAAWVELQPHTRRTHQLRVHMAAIGHPIVGDGKYGGKDAFLSGTISRKMHLHARRIRVDHPDGGRVDVRAELPEHFAASLTSLGFDIQAGDLPLDEEIARKPTREDEKKAARAHAKQIRKGRKGERRSRGESGPRKK
ncbi:MAG TPA: RluA family pseudouridine synthase [Sphingobium sp.]|nr:RluA family pseudouridine synthase [Sphingobium sp.]